MASIDHDSAQSVAEQALTFDDLCDLFLEHGCHTPPSELHGMVSGWLCGSGRSAKQWLGMAAEHLDLEEGLPPKSQMKLLILLAQTLRQLKSEDLGFQPLWPDDESEMEQRIGALAHWCNGFLAGFGLSGMKTEHKEVSASLGDLANFARIDAEGAEEGDEAERDWFEVSEYVRVAAMMIFSECNESEVKPPEQSSEQASEQASGQTPAQAPTQVPGSDMTRH